MLTMQDVGSAIGGVRLSDKPILGPHAGPAPTTAATAEAPGMFERVKQLVGLGPASTTAAVCFLFCLAAVCLCTCWTRCPSQSFGSHMLQWCAVSRYGMLRKIVHIKRSCVFPDQQSPSSHFCLQDQYEAADAPSSPIIASQGINAGIMGSSGRADSTAGLYDDDEDDDAFEDAVEDPAFESFTSDAGTGADNRQPYVSQPGPPVVDTRNDPDETFGPLKHRDQAAQPGDSYEPSQGPAAFGDDEEEGTPGKKGLRARVKGKFGSRKEHHQEKKRNKADQELQHKMHEKEIPKAQAVTVGVLDQPATRYNTRLGCILCQTGLASYEPHPAVAITQTFQACARHLDCTLTV